MAWAGALTLFTGCADPRPPLRTVEQVDLHRYLGTWQVIANIPYWLEDGKVATADVYGLRDDGTMDNVYRFRRGSFDAPEESWHGTAWVVDAPRNAHWKVQFIWPIAIDYLIIDLDPDYRWAVIGHPSRNYGWILARDRQLDPVVYRGILSRLADQGYAIERFALVPQPP